MIAITESSDEIDRPTPAAIRSAAASLMRSLPLFFARRPGTPLRVLCVAAFDAVCRLRCGHRLSDAVIQQLVAILDYGAAVNDFFDRSGFSHEEYRATLRLLDDTGMRCIAREYRSCLRDLEQSRPVPWGDTSNFEQIRQYRESVVCISLNTLAAVAFQNQPQTVGNRTGCSDQDIEVLFRLVMLCQIIDDVRDFATDTERRLPSFLTAQMSADDSIASTVSAAMHYAEPDDVSRLPRLFPFRMAIRAVFRVAQFALFCRHRQLKLFPKFAGARPLTRHGSRLLPAVVPDNTRSGADL